MPELIDKLKGLMENAEDVRHVPRLLAEFGIRFLIVEHLPQSKMDGATFWLSNVPVIVMSLRFDRIDYFWYTLMHEVGHVANEDGRAESAPVVDEDIMDEARAQRMTHEAKANAFAANALVPQAELKDFVVRVHPLYSAARIQGFARVIEYMRALSLGQLQHQGMVKYANLRQLLVKVRALVTSTALDRWLRRLRPPQVPTEERA